MINSEFSSTCEMICKKKGGKVTKWITKNPLNFSLFLFISNTSIDLRKMLMLTKQSKVEYFCHTNSQNQHQFGFEYLQNETLIFVRFVHAIMRSGTCELGVSCISCVHWLRAKMEAMWLAKKKKRAAKSILFFFRLFIILSNETYLKWWLRT